MQNTACQEYAAEVRGFPHPENRGDAAPGTCYTVHNVLPGCTF